MKQKKKKKGRKLFNRNKSGAQSNIYIPSKRKSKVKRTKYRLKNKKLLRQRIMALGLIVILMMVCILMIQKLVVFVTNRMIQTEILETGYIEKDYKTQGLLLKNETLVYAPKEGVFAQRIQEGARVPAQQIVGYIAGDVQQKQYRQLLEQAEVQYQNQKNLLEENIKKSKEQVIRLNTEILAKTNTLSQTSLGYQKVDIVTTSQELRELGVQRNNLIGEIKNNESKLKNTEKQLQAKKETLEKKYLSGTVALKSPLSGLISFRFDGLEEQCKPAHFSELQINSIDTLKLNARQVKDGSTVLTEAPAFKIVDNHHCDIAFVYTAKSGTPFEKGKNIRYRIGKNDKVFTSTVKELKREGNQLLVMFSHNQFDDYFLQQRKMDLEIIDMKNYGVLIPVNSIVKIDDKEGIYQKKRGVISFVPLKIVIKNEVHAIASEFSGQGQIITNPKLVMWREKLFPNHAKKQ